MKQAKPVTIITGFLGCGKTTFLNSYIQFLNRSKLAVIENEFGEQGIDGDLIIGADGNMFELNNGCLCCTLSQDFFGLLEQLSERSEEYDELVIETTGIADPAAVASPFLTNHSVPYFFKLKRVLCLVDARHIEGQLQVTEEARIQISFSDMLLITKTDLITPDYLGYLEKLLTGINPFATVYSGSKDQYPHPEISNFDRQMNAKEGKPKFSLVKQAVGQHQHHDLISLSFTFDDPFDLQILEHRLLVFLNFQAKDIYRVKGIIHAEDHERRIIVQSVSSDLVISAGPDWEKEETRTSRIVFIGKKLKPAGFEKMLRHCLALPSLNQNV